MGMVDFTFFPTSVRMETFGESRYRVRVSTDSDVVYNPYHSNTPLLLPMDKGNHRRKQKINQ